MALYRKAEQILVEEAPVAPLFYTRAQRLVKPWIKGFHLAPTTQEIWKNVIIEPRQV
jgi:ABC-type oligopeptide transport system substrate-binding subunit